MQNAKQCYFSILATILVFHLMWISTSFADDGMLMAPYPPNVQAENFELLDIDGNVHKLSDFRGKFVLVNFWSMSCNICKSEMTSLQDAYELLGATKLAVISIHAGDNISGASEVLKLNNITFIVLIDKNLTMGNWGIPVLPTTFLVDPEGNINYRAVGARVWNSPFMIDFLQAKLNSYELKVSLNNFSLP